MTFLENDGQIFAATSLSLQEIDASVFGFVLYAVFEDLNIKKEHSSSEEE